MYLRLYKAYGTGDVIFKNYESLGEIHRDITDVDNFS